MNPSTFVLFLLVVSFSLSYAAPPFAVYTIAYGSPNYLHIFAGDNTGNITYVNQVSTGGNGGAIQSQGSLCTIGNYIFAVNSLSNTLSMFSVNSQDPTMVTMVGSPVSTGGDWPLSVAAYNNITCVVTSGVMGILRCFTFSSAGLTVVPSSDRNFSLGLTNPPVSHTGPGQISFTPNGKAVVITVKTATPPVMVYSIDSQGMPSLTHTSSPIIGSVPFAFVFDTDGSIVLVDAAPNGTYSGIIDMTIDSTTWAVNLLTPNYFIIPDQKAACWIGWDSTSTHFFAANAGSMNITELSRSSTTFTVIKEYSIGFGITDNIVGWVGSESFLYQLSGGAKAIYVVKISTKTIVAQAPTPSSAMSGMIYIAAASPPSSSSSSSTGSSSGFTVVPTTVLQLALALLALLSLLFA